MVSRSPCRGLSHPLLSLFLDIFALGAIVSGIIFLYFFSVNSLLLHRKAIYFVSCYFAEAAYGFQ
jgi:hypothetical protein